MRLAARRERQAAIGDGTWKLGRLPSPTAALSTDPACARAWVGASVARLGHTADARERVRLGFGLVGAGMTAVSIGDVPLATQSGILIRRPRSRQPDIRDTIES